MATELEIRAASEVRVTTLQADTKYRYRYCHYDKDVVVQAANYAVGRTDMCRSPKASAPYKHGSDWACDVTYYSLD